MSIQHVIQQGINRFGNQIIASKFDKALDHFDKYKAQANMRMDHPEIFLVDLARAHRGFREDGGFVGQLQRLFHAKAKERNTFKGLKLPKE